MNHIYRYHLPELFCFSERIHKVLEKRVPIYLIDKDKLNSVSSSDGERPHLQLR